MSQVSDAHYRHAALTLSFYIDHNGPFLFVTGDAEIECYLSSYDVYCAPAMDAIKAAADLPFSAVVQGIDDSAKICYKGSIASAVEFVNAHIRETEPGVYALRFEQESQAECNL